MSFHIRCTVKKCWKQADFAPKCYNSQSVSFWRASFDREKCHVCVSFDDGSVGSCRWCYHANRLLRPLLPQRPKYTNTKYKTSVVDETESSLRRQRRYANVWLTLPILYYSDTFALAYCKHANIKSLFLLVTKINCGKNATHSHRETSGCTSVQTRGKQKGKGKNKVH